MIYISHLLPDEEMQELLKSSELGVESIEFSISENLDHLDKTIETYKLSISILSAKSVTIVRDVQKTGGRKWN